MNRSGNKAPDARSLALRLLLMAIAMFGFGFLMVPLYSVFCEVTGFGGKTNTVAAVVQATAGDDRVIDLEFDTTVNQYAPWEFDSTVDSMSIHPGVIYTATFTARNLADRHMTAQAVPSIAPGEAAKYFKKLECFCFTTQEFEAHEYRVMPVRFIVQQEIPDYIETITLSYTFFDTARVAQLNGHKTLSRGAKRN